MIILAGIDEAGLGPGIGPLATGCAAFSVPEGKRPDSLWEELADACCREWRKGEARLGVADSKELYKFGGVEALERTLAAFSLLANGGAGMLPLGFSGLEGGAVTHPCYSRSLEPFPLHCQADAVADAADRLRAALKKARTSAAHLAAAALHEPVLNRRYAQGLNKNQALLMETGAHLAILAAKFPEARLHVVVDKQGGRNEYLPFLTALFPGLWVETLAAGAERSSYRVRRGGGDMEIHFVAKADRDSFATALASLAAKYVRERAMAELNAWFRRLLPELKPTAGYYSDVRRWLAAVREGCGKKAMLELILRER